MESTKFEYIPFEEIGNITPNTFGYIDKDGNFYSIGKAKTSYGCLNANSTKGMGRTAQFILLMMIPEDERQKYTEGIETFYLDSNIANHWPANQKLQELGFCLFMREYHDREDPYEDASFYKNASLNQLIVMNYLFALNGGSSTRIDKKRKELWKLYIQEQSKLERAIPLKRVLENKEE